MHSPDTSRGSRARQLEAVRRMTPEQRVEEAAAMSDEVDSIVEAGLRHRHPDYSDDEIRAALVAIRLR